MSGIRKVVFISSSCGATRRYRVDHQAEQLRNQGIATQMIDARDGSFSGHYGNANVIILHRVAFSPLLQRVNAEARRQGSVVLMDVDDLVFEPSLASQVGGYHLMESEWQRKNFTRHLENQRLSLQAAHGVIASTERLGEHCRQLNARVMVNRNALCAATVRLSEVQNALLGERTGGCVLGYFSGTPTHDADFETITGVLNTIFQRFPEVSLLVAGHLTIPKKLKFQERLRYVEPVSWEKLPALIKQVDVNLAPLDLMNPFCHCKSEVKYIEAGILKVPTIASSTDGFKEVINDGENGMLAGGVDEWVDKLSALVADCRLRRAIGGRAYHHVRCEYVPERRAEQFAANLASMVKKVTEERVSHRGSVNLHYSIQYPTRPPAVPGSGH